MELTEESTREQGADQAHRDTSRRDQAGGREQTIPRQVIHQASSCAEVQGFCEERGSHCDCTCHERPGLDLDRVIVVQVADAGWDEVQRAHEQGGDQGGGEKEVHVCSG